MLLNTSTDDFPFAYDIKQVLDRLCTELQRLFDITTKGGIVLKYLNLRIIQT
jgi:hypothetical protein